MIKDFSGALITCEGVGIRDRIRGRKLFSLWPNMVRENVLLGWVSREGQVIQSFTLSASI